MNTVGIEQLLNEMYLITEVDYEKWKKLIIKAFENGGKIRENAIREMIEEMQPSYCEDEQDEGYWTACDDILTKLGEI